MKDIGERLTGYEPLWENWYKDSYLGSGGSGKVYRFRQELYGQVRYCAVKVLPIMLDRSVLVTRENREQELAERRRQMAEEIKNMYLLNDKPHLVHCINHTYREIKNDEGETVGFDVLIQMEYYRPLPEYIDQKGVLSPAETERLARQIGQALREMHGINMLHRDIKPENIYVDDSGSFYLGDFGIAKQTQAASFATFVGTQPFMAPEVWNARTPMDQHYGTAADIYSLGMTLYYLLNGNRLPLVQPGDNRNAVDAAIFARLSGKVFAEPENGGSALKKVVMDCCAFDPANRIQTAEELIARLDSCGDTVEYSAESVRAAAAKNIFPLSEEDLDDSDDGEEDFVMTDSLFVRPFDEDEEELIVRPAPAKPERRPKQREEHKEKESPKLAASTKRAALTIGLTLCCILGVGLLFFTKTVCLHAWASPSCTKLSTCTKCGKTRGSLAAHSFEDATCAHPRRCTVCGIESGAKLKHSWKEATCTQPKTCALCGSVEGEALGHVWKDADCELPQYCEVCGLVGQEAPGHRWIEATCDEPKTCEVCEETEGEPLGHDWKKATCTEPETCQNCGETKGKAKGHEWTAATLTAPKTCSVCGATEGSALDYVSQGTMYVDTDGETLALREERSAYSTQLASIPDCTQIQVWYTGSSGWYYALYDNTYGYVNSKYISATDPMLGDGTVTGFTSGYLEDVAVTVKSAEVKNGKLTVSIDLSSFASDLIWSDFYFYYNGSAGANGNLISSKNVIIMPYADKNVTVSCKVESGFGRASISNIVVVDSSGNKLILEP